MALNGGPVCGEMLCIYLKLGSIKIMDETKNCQGMFCTLEFV